MLDSRFLLDLRTFDDEEEFDFDKFSQEFEENWQEDDSSSEEEEEEDNSSSEEEDSESESEEEEDSKSEEESQKQEEGTQQQKNDRAFADLRRKADENEKFARFVKGVADKSGMTPEQVIEAYEQQNLAKEAEEQKIPVETLKRIRDLETDNKNTKEQAQRDKLNSDITSTMQKYNLTEDEVKSTIKQALSDNINLYQTPFEKVHQIVNFDTIVEKRVEAARQKDLENKKKRQESSAPPNESSGKTNDLDDVEADVLAFLKESGDI
jgi:hypothetical protein